ncbi:MAG: metallophosphoesterase family protein [bacterium]
MKYKILLISDTHNNHKGLDKKFGELPPADFIIHAGDITGSGDEYSTKEFLDWFSSLYQYDHKIFIAGNHDWIFEINNFLAKRLVPENVHYLEDSYVELWGLKIYGTPVTPIFYNWAFNRPEEKLKQHWSAIPDDTDILITHGPPHGVLDFASHHSQEHTGSPSLYDEVINRIKPKVHVFGHIHEEYGQKEINGIKFVNASVLNARYQMVNKPILIEIEKT